MAEPIVNHAPGLDAPALIRALLAATSADQVTVPRVALEAVLAALPETARQRAEESPALLTVEQAAARLRISPASLYKQARTLPFAVKLSRKALRFDADGLARWVAARRVA